MSAEGSNLYRGGGRKQHPVKQGIYDVSERSGCDERKTGQHTSGDLSRTILPDNRHSVSAIALPHKFRYPPAQKACP